MRHAKVKDGVIVEDWMANSSWDHI